MAEFCKEVQQWVEEKVEKRVERWIEREERKCKKKKCKRWCACCNKWYCWTVTTVVKVVTKVVITVGKWATRVVCEIVEPLLTILAILFSIVFSIPVIGRLVRLIWNFVVEVIWRLVGLPGLIADLIGLRWEKRLRVCIVILSGREGPVATAATLSSAIEEATRIYKDQANVKLIVDDVLTRPGKAPEGVLHVGCNEKALGEDLWWMGSWFEFEALRYCLRSAGRRLIGYASPVVVFVVREVEGTTAGCSLGPFSDYVTIESPNGICFAHEVGHACGLGIPRHDRHGDNLMNARCGRDQLHGWQEILLRNSRHVTYL